MKYINLDSSDDAFNFYESVYAGLVPMGYSRKYKREIASYPLGNKSFIVSGDVCFNIKLGNQRDCMGSLIPKGIQVPMIIDKYIHSALNISILPVEGNLNGIKKGIGDDRMDTFIWALDHYYKGENEAIILNNGNYPQLKMVNRLTVKEFLAGYNGVNQFCKKIYGITPKIVKTMSDSGSNSITTLKKLKEYVLLAIDFWRARAAYYRNIPGIQDYLPTRNEIIRKDVIIKWFDSMI